MQEEKVVGKLVNCVSVGTYEGKLTRGQKYIVLEHDSEQQRVRIRGNNGRIRWYPMYCFDLEGGSVPILLRWQFDDPIEDEADDWVEVSFDLSDGTRRWCSLVTPARLKWHLEQPLADPGVRASHLIVIRSLSSEDVDRMLRLLDQQDELLDASLPLGPREQSEDPKSAVPPELFGAPSEQRE